MIVGINGKQVRSLADLTEQLEQAGVGQSVRLTVRRDGRSISIDTQVTDVSRTS